MCLNERGHQLGSFRSNLVGKLGQCFNNRSEKLQVDKMWGHYHEFRTSEGFWKDWNQFVESIVQIKPSIFFCQHVTDIVFNELIKLGHPVQSADEEASSTDLTTFEQTSLRYVSGYVCQKVGDRIAATKPQALKDDLTVL